LPLKKNIKLFHTLGVLSANEVESRKNIYFEQYCKTINIEGTVASQMATTFILPPAIKYQQILANSIKVSKEITKLDFSPQEEVLKELTHHINGLIVTNKKLSVSLQEAKHHHDHPVTAAKYFRDVVKINLQETRDHADALESIVADEFWLLPKYYDMLFLK